MTGMGNRREKEGETKYKIDGNYTEWLLWLPATASFTAQVQVYKCVRECMCVCVFVLKRVRQRAEVCVNCLYGMYGNLQASLG